MTHSVHIEGGTKIESFLEKLYLKDVVLVRAFFTNIYGNVAVTKADRKSDRTQQT